MTHQATNCTASRIPCLGCGALVPQMTGPTHRYMASAPGCWSVYGEVLAREYSDPPYAARHQLTVDAYAIQHPGQPSRQSIQSVAVHLISLCLILERDLAPPRARQAIQKISRDRVQFAWLTPPATRGAVTVAEVHGAEAVAEHLERVSAWAESAWAAWAMHHATVRQWLPR